MDIGFLKTHAVRIAMLAVLVAGIGVFLLTGGHDAFSFESIADNKDDLVEWAEMHPVLAPAGFVTAYLILGLFGLPGSTVLNLTSGLLFDFWQGLLLVVAGSTLASSLAFFSFRYLFRDFVKTRVQRRFPNIEETLKSEGAYFVFAMRLVPLVPYSLTNLILSVSPVSFWTYFGMTLLAMLPRYLLYVYTGAYLGDIRDPNDLFSPSLIVALALLAVLPLVSRWIARKLKLRFPK